MTVPGEAQQRAEDVLFSLYKPVTLTVGEAEQLARDVLALCDRVEAAKKERNEMEKQRDFDYKRFSEAKAALISDGKARAAAEKQVELLTKALREIAEGEGPFSRDPMTHAENTIEAMKDLARAALSGTAEEKT